MPARRIDDQRPCGAWEQSPTVATPAEPCDLVGPGASRRLNDDRGRERPFPVSTRQRSPDAAAKPRPRRPLVSTTLPPPLPEQAQIAVVKRIARVSMSAGVHVPSGRLPRRPSRQQRHHPASSSLEITPTPPRRAATGLELGHAPCRTGPRGRPARPVGTCSSGLGRQSLGGRRVKKAASMPATARRICAGAIDLRKQRRRPPVVVGSAGWLLALEHDDAARCRKPLPPPVRARQFRRPIDR